MTNWKKLGGTTALVTLMTGSAAFADVTAQQVWSDWKTYMQGFGYDLSSSEATSGDTLTVSDIKMGLDLPENEGTMSIAMGTISFTNRGDGTVEIGVPASMPLVVNVMPEGADPVTVNATYTNTGLSMIVSGTADEMTYTYSAADLGLALGEITAEGKTISVGKVMLMMKNVAGNSVMKIGNMRDVVQTFTAGELVYDIDVANPDDAKETFKLAGTMTDLTSNANATYPNGGLNGQDLNAILKAGMSVDGRFSYAGGNSNFSFVDGDDTMQAQTSSESGSLAVVMSQDMLTYDVASKGVSMNVAGGDIPFPIALQMAESGFNLTLPVSKSDDEQDFALGVTLGGFTMSDMIWGIFDPSGQLPRDPATVAFDVSGKAKLFFDLFDPEQMQAVERGQAMPGEVNAVNINSLEVTVAGASLTGDGAFTLDNTDLESFDGMPAPTGAANLKLVGANGLMDKLVAMGLLPEDQAMGARMMMGLFAVPGEGDDTLTSKLEVTADGQVLANGQRLK